MVTGSTAISQLPTGTIDNLQATFPISIGMPSSPQTIRATFPQMFLLVNQQGLGFISSYIEGLELGWTHATGTSVGSGKAYAQNGDLINITGSIATVHSGLTASSWYHVYVYLSAGVPSVEYSTTVPANPFKANARSKTGDSSRRYAGSFITDSTGAVRKFQHNIKTDTMYYLKFRSDLTPHRALNNGKNGSATAVSLTGTVAISGFEALIRVTNLGEKSLFTSDDSGVSSTQNTVALTAGNVATQSAFLLHPVDTEQRLFYAFASTVTGSLGGFVDVLGYNFDR